MLWKHGEALEKRTSTGDKATVVRETERELLAAGNGELGPGEGGEVRQRRKEGVDIRNSIGRDVENKFFKGFRAIGDELEECGMNGRGPGGNVRF